MLLALRKTQAHTLCDGQIRAIGSKHIISLFLLHVSSLEVRSIKDEAVRACSALESVQAARILRCGIGTPDS